MSSKRIKGITVEIGGDTTKLDKALESSNKTLSQTQKALKDVERLLSIFEDMSYLMAKHARPDEVTATSSEEWLDGFDTFSVYQVFPAIAQLWQANLKTTSTPKKKRGRRKGR